MPADFPAAEWACDQSWLKNDHREPSVNLHGKISWWKEGCKDVVYPSDAIITGLGVRSHLPLRRIHAHTAENREEQEATCPWWLHHVELSKLSTEHFLSADFSMEQVINISTVQGYSVGIVHTQRKAIHVGNRIFHVNQHPEDRRCSCQAPGENSTAMPYP